MKKQDDKLGFSEVNYMEKFRLKPCKICGKSNIAIEMWSSGGLKYMVKCNNPDCAVPPEGYPTGSDLIKIKEEWNRRQEIRS